MMGIPALVSTGGASSVSSSFEAGQRVQARWQGSSRTAPATVLRAERGELGRRVYDLVFDDGRQEARAPQAALLSLILDSTTTKSQSPAAKSSPASVLQPDQPVLAFLQLRTGGGSGAWRRGRVVAPATAPEAEG